MLRFVRGFVLVLAAGGLLFLPACQDDPAPTPVPTPAPPVRGVVFTGPFADFQPDLYYAIPIPLTQAGILDFTVDWTFTNTYMVVAFGTQSCTFAELSSNRCPFLVRTEGTTPKPRVVITQNLATGTYYLVLYSQPWNKKLGYGSDSIESVALQIGLTVGVTASGAVPMAPIRLQAQVIKP